MKYTLPNGFDPNALYVVFRSASGTLTAVRATYDAETGELVFTTGNLGHFTVVSFAFGGLEFSADFYAALADLDAVKTLS